MNNSYIAVFNFESFLRLQMVYDFKYFLCIICTEKARKLEST